MQHYLQQFETDAISEMVLDEARITHPDVRAFANAVMRRLPDGTPIPGFVEALFKAIWRLTEEDEEEEEDKEDHP